MVLSANRACGFCGFLGQRSVPYHQLVLMDGWMDGGWMDDGWMDGWMNGWMDDGWMDGWWMDG